MINDIISNKKKKKEILVVEDSPTQALKLQYLLEEHSFSYVWAKNGLEALNKTKENKPDLIVSDIVMPKMDGYKLCSNLKTDNALKNIPVILLTALTGTENIIKGLNVNADFYITKPYEEDFLLSKIKLLLSKKITEQRDADEELEIILDGKTHRISANRKQILNLLLSTHENLVLHNKTLTQTQEALRKLNEGLEEKVREKTAHLLTEITEHKQAEEALCKSEEKYRTLYHSSADAIMLLTPEEGFSNGNSAAIKMFGCKDEKEFISRTLYDLSPQYQPDGTLSSKKAKQMMAIAMEKGSHFFEWTHKRVDGREFPAAVLLTRMELQGRRMLQATVRDITKRKQVREERNKLEAQLSQAQKMEAIGVLAGGVAHDFNNILTVIIGNAQLALMNVIKDESLRNGIEETMKAGERAASLTRQLLAFSRKQIITPRVLDLNKLLTGIEKMLGRLIVENIELLTIPEPALWQVEVDPGQMEQVIMNLAVNAGDAMPKGGKLTIETANIYLAENYFHEHGIKNEPGSYVMLTVSDTGSGMDKETREHIFEPFFTTKEVGKGTGLGLSTVYGIVKQNNGFVWVYSEPGQGTTFKVYLPRVKEDAESEEKEQPPVVELGGFETILVVEDDYGLRRFAQEVLLQHGYRVLDAENGEDALRISQAHEGPIHLMITDVVMPRMGGKEAAERLQPLYPHMKVIYMSGYTDDAIVEHGVLAPGLNFLQKPFSPESLACKVREMLDQGTDD